MNYCIIPIRFGSKSIKNKNIIDVKGKPLSYYAISEAIKSKVFSRIILSSDSKYYLKIFKKIFKNKLVYHLRSKKNSQNTSTSESVIIEVMNKYNLKGNNCFLVQSTSPLVKKIDFIMANQYFNKHKLDSLFTGFKKKIFIWRYIKNRLYPLNYNFRKRQRRQKTSLEIFENGAFYIFNIKKFLKKKNRLFGKIGCYVMPEERSIEIDEKNDLKKLNRLIEK